MTMDPGLRTPIGANAICSDPALTIPFQLRVKSKVEDWIGGCGPGLPEVVPACQTGAPTSIAELKIIITETRIRI